MNKTDMEIASFLKYKFDKICMVFVVRGDVQAFSSYASFIGGFMRTFIDIKCYVTLALKMLI